LSTEVIHSFDIIVIGGGHAGCEAALAAARMGMRTLMLTLRRDRIGHMPCNPAVGGLAKGHLVKELDALGGEIGRATDRAGIQFRMLNRAKGPAVWSPRAQVDKRLYARLMQETVCSQPRVVVREAEVESIRVSENSFAGVRLADGDIVNARACVLTTGTFLRGLMHTGDRRTNGGREGEPPATTLSESLLCLGLKMGRLKTGTPPRVLRNSVDFSRLTPQPGDDPPVLFSRRTACVEQPQVLCHLTFTSEETHDVIRGSLDRSPLYSGVITGIGPRYCPSIEDKVVRFPDKTRHQVFVEPEGLDHPELYMNGISTSLPVDVQERILATLPGFEQARMARPGYAVEYDFFPPDQIRRTMESKAVERLYFAGQVNGTSGYEEAAAQGFVAGVNAVLALRGEEPFVPGRDEAYVGVLIDDLTTKEIDEPYRMFTSRAEFRLLLRQDNADERLTAAGVRLGLVDARALDEVRHRTERVRAAVTRLESTAFPSATGSARFEELGLDAVRHGASLRDVLRRPGVTMSHLRSVLALESDLDLDDALECAVKYQGYVERQARDVRGVRDLESRSIPHDFPFDRIKGLSAEAREKLTRKRPETIGQASRIAGVRASDLSIIAVFLERHRRASA
jgi:tRNA uridine 5-carboxymethylaminomethyl modification enzyme